MGLPDNYSRLHGGEERFRAESLALVEGDEMLTLHLGFVHMCLDGLQYNRVSYEAWDEDQRTIQLIGAQVFNSIGAALKLVLSGYYQASGLQIRFVLEAGWLLDYFSTDTTLVDLWRKTPEDKRQNVFRPGKIRTTLDLRDGFTDKKRDAHYKRLSVLSGHPTLASFNMLRSDPTQLARMGPFVERALLATCIQELVMVSAVAFESFSWFFPPVALTDYYGWLGYLRYQREWSQKVYGKPQGLARIREVERAIELIEKLIGPKKGNEDRT